MNLATKHLTISILVIVILLTVLFNLGGTEKDISTYLPPSSTQTAAVADFNSSLVAHYTFDDTANDSAGSNNGTASGGPTYVAGKIGKAISFDGVNDRINITDPVSGVLDFGTDSFSYGLWVYVTQNSGNHDMPLFKGGASAVTAGYDMELGNSLWLANLSDGTDTVGFTFSAGPLLNQWVHLMTVVDRSVQRGYVYVNGVVVSSSGTDISSIDSVSNATNISISHASYPFNGKIDDVRIYNRALDSSEVSQLYTLGSGGGTPAPTPDPTPTPTPPVVTPTPAPSGSQTAGNVYYVSVDGNDANNGLSLSTPWKTIIKAARTLQAGDTVNIRGGTYAETSTIEPINSGTPSNIITYQNYNNEQVIIYKENHGHLFFINGKSYILIKGIHFTGVVNSISNPATALGIYLYNGASNIIIDSVEVDKNEVGIYVAGLINPISNITIKNSRVHDNTSHGVYFYSRVYDSVIGPNNAVYNNKNNAHPEYVINGIEIAYGHSGTQDLGPKRITVIGNEVYGNGMQGIRTGMVTDVLIKNNHTHHNGATGIQLEDISENVIVEGNRSENNNQYFAGETGIWVDDSKNVVVRDNYIANNDIGLFVGGKLAIPSHRVIIRNNVVVNNNRGVSGPPNGGIGLNLTYDASDVSVAHNVFYNNGNAANAYRGQISLCAYNNIKVHRVHLKNNIISNPVPNPVYSVADFMVHCSDYTSDYELFYNSVPVKINYLLTNYTLPQYVALTGQEAHSIEQNPLLLSDQRLQLNSPAINRGGFLATTVGSGNGSTVAVSDASYFTDGFGVVDGDMIKIGNKPLVKIMDVDYVNNQLTLDQTIQWTTGEGVSYPYNGSAPDIGAYEYQGSGTTPPPITPPVTSPTYKLGDFNKDGAVNALDFSLLSGAWNTNTSTYDLNSDGIVNTLDYVIMVQNWTG